MTLLEILKDQELNEEQIQAVQNSMKENKIYTTSLENVDERYNKLKTQKTELEVQITERDKQLKDLSKNNIDNEELTKQIEQLQLSNKQTKDDYENKIASIQFNYALEGALTSAKCKNNKALKALLDMNNIKYQEGKIEGLDTQLEGLRKDASYLFEAEQTQGGSGFNPGGEPGFKNPFSKEHFNLTEQAKLLKENPSLANKLRNSK